MNLVNVDGIQVIDPLEFSSVMWPDVTFYREQKDVIYSVVDNSETFVVAGNDLGKDYVAAFLVLWAFLSFKVVRIITTSVRDDHLRVLWGEMGRFIQNSKYPVVSKRKRDMFVGKSSVSGGPLIVNYREIKKYVDGRICPISYVRGMVSEHAEGLAGHHAPFTLGIVDEASGVSNDTLAMFQTWAKRILVFGNPMPCSHAHFFYKGVRGGDILVPTLSNGKGRQKPSIIGG